VLNLSCLAIKLAVLAHCDYLFSNHSFVIGGLVYTVEFLDIHMTMVYGNPPISHGKRCHLTGKNPYFMAFHTLLMTGSSETSNICHGFCQCRWWWFSVLLKYEQLLYAVVPQCSGTRTLDVAPDKVTAVFHQRQWQHWWRQCHSCWWQFTVCIDGKMAKQWDIKALPFAPPFYGSRSSQFTHLPLQSILTN